MGFKNVESWNKAAIFKHMWAVSCKKDNLWVKWVHQVYIRGEDFWEHSAPASSSWYWRNVVSIKDAFKGYYRQGLIGREYTIAKGYKLIQGDTARVYWDKLV